MALALHLHLQRNCGANPSASVPRAFFVATAGDKEKRRRRRRRRRKI
jgi:hypothetical protein